MNDKGSILVVDDEELVRSLIARMLEKEGYEILGAADAEEAIRLLRRYTERLSLVIMDLSVSGLSRQDPGLIRRLREARPDLPILLTSGYDEKDVTPEMVREGIADFLAKPYPPGMLEEKVRDLLSLPTASSVHLGSPTGRI